MKGRSSITRYCDDLVMVFENYKDCTRVYKVLGKRLEKFGLKLHPGKTCIVDFRFKRPVSSELELSSTFKFLGFAHLWRKSRNEKFVAHQRTAKERLAKAIGSISD